LEGKEPAASQLGYLIHDTSPLRTVLSCVVCFHAAELPCGSSTTFTVALQVTRPLPYPQPTNHLKTRGYRLVGRPANGVARGCSTREIPGSLNFECLSRRIPARMGPDAHAYRCLFQLVATTIYVAPQLPKTWWQRACATPRHGSSPRMALHRLNVTPIELVSPCEISLLSVSSSSSGRPQPSLSYPCISTPQLSLVSLDPFLCIAAPSPPRSPLLVRAERPRGWYKPVFSTGAITTRGASRGAIASRQCLSRLLNASTAPYSTRSQLRCAAV
jgi:hypothetical protein